MLRGSVLGDNICRKEETSYCDMLLHVQWLRPYNLYFLWSYEALLCNGRITVLVARFKEDCVSLRELQLVASFPKYFFVAAILSSGFCL